MLGTIRAAQFALERIQTCTPEPPIELQPTMCGGKLPGDQPAAMLPPYYIAMHEAGTFEHTDVFGGRRE